MTEKEAFLLYLNRRRLPSAMLSAYITGAEPEDPRDGDMLVELLAAWRAGRRHERNQQQGKKEGK